jgi:hypothetical protein
MALISLVYVSSGKDDLTDEDFKNILNSCRRNNQPRNVTGMLLYRNGYFIQVLEGEETDVDFIYQRIAADPRHDHVVLVEKNRITERAFPDWSMGFNDLSHNVGEHADLVKVFNNEEEFLGIKPSHARQLLQTFAREDYF